MIVFDRDALSTAVAQVLQSRAQSVDRSANALGPLDTAFLERIARVPRRESIGARIKRLRLARGLSQRDLAAPGVSYAYVSRIEAGGRVRPHRLRPRCPPLRRRRQTSTPSAVKRGSFGENRTVTLSVGLPTKKFGSQHG
jgi:hypothetical protein